MADHTISPEDADARLDVWLSHNLKACSRAHWQALIKDGHVLVNGESRKAHYVLHEGDVVSETVPPPEAVQLVAEDIPLDVLHEDPDLIVINKQAGLVVHPAPGHDGGTLVNALLFHCKDPAGGGTSLAGVGGELRPGIVHRLDKDTSGVMVAAKNDQAMNSLMEQFKGREVRKEYTAVVWGELTPPKGTVESLIGRSAHDRKKMSAKPPSGREAVTHYETIEQFADTALIRVRIETGRTHQIRVHMAHVHHPVVGDKQYGRARVKQLPVNRQMLHASKLAFQHPGSGDAMVFEAPLPEDMTVLIASLRGEV